MIELTKFSHDRRIPFEQSCDALRDVINAFVEQPELNDWYDYFSSNYSLPKNVIKQQVRRYLEEAYHYQKCAFEKKVFFKTILQTTIRHIGFLFYTFFMSKKTIENTKHYDLMVGGIASEIELLRFSKLINLYGRNNVLITTVKPINNLGYKTLYRPSCKFYDRSESIRTLYRELVHGLKLHLSESCIDCKSYNKSISLLSFHF